jgi:hypothetical protein
MTTQLFKRDNFFDFMQVSKDDLEAEQDFHLNNTAAVADTVAGSGIILDFPQENIIFDSDILDELQQEYVALDTFDGQGVMSSVYTCSDRASGNQISVAFTNANLYGVVNAGVMVIGKTFDDQLIYEFLEFSKNITKVTHNHFKEVTNLLFQNLKGNINTSIDGYGCFNVGGRVLITECSSMKLDRGYIAAEQILEPDLRLAKFKTSDVAKSLHEELTSAIGSSNNIDDLNINTTTASDRQFAASADSSLIIAQKFKMMGNNIQKISIAMGLSSGTDWSGTLEIGIRPLLDTTSVSTDYLPDSQIGFDPDINPIESVFLTQDDLLKAGVVLNSDYSIIDVVFSGTKLANPSISTLVDGQYYAITIRRFGLTATGTLTTPEARNSNTEQRLSVFDSGVWTDVADSTLWFRVWTDGAFIASGAAYDAGIRIVQQKLIIGTDGVTEQSFSSSVPLIGTSEDEENYIIVQRSDQFSDIIAHPRTGDPQASRRADIALFSSVSQDDLGNLFEAGGKPIVIGRMRDRNPKNNPSISGTLNYPGLAINNTVDIINPSSDLLLQNVVGSIITPNTLQPTRKYRIISQDIITDVYGDLDGDGIVSVTDAARMVALDGYAPSLNQGSTLAATQLAAVLNGTVSVAELLRADLSDDGYVTTAADGYQMTQYLAYGTGFTSGSSFTRVRLTVEPLSEQMAYLTSAAESILRIHEIDTSLVNNTSFSALTFGIEYVPVWNGDDLEVLDLRRFVTTTFLNFDITDLQSTEENGGLNSAFIPGDLYLTGEVKNLDGTFHALDFERNIIEIELPEGDTIGEVNILSSLVVGKMKFSDGTFASSSAILNNQVKFEVAISSVAKNLDGYDYNDGYFIADEIIGTYIDHNSGLLRLHCKNIKESATLPELRSRILVTVSLKKAGFNNLVTKVTSLQLAELLV